MWSSSTRSFINGTTTAGDEVLLAVSDISKVLKIDDATTEVTLSTTGEKTLIKAKYSDVVRLITE